MCRSTLVEVLSGNGSVIKAVKNGREALVALADDHYDLVITDQKMPYCDGTELLKITRREYPESIVVMMMTGYATTTNAVEAIKIGAFDYISKPLKSDAIKAVVKKALNQARRQIEKRIPGNQTKQLFNFDKMVGASDGMKLIYKKIEKVAASDSTIAIYGESGTGKELVARALHAKSDRCDGPFITVNCGAIPEDLLESELFGHEKGAFTGAICNRTGRFELAHGGTIFLDEIGDMSPTLQVKVLRVIQEREFERIGGMKSITVDVRIITATNQDLEKAVAEKKFREDLFYRINVIPIHLPPLRKRGSDIPLLADHFLRIFNKSKNNNIKGLTPEALDCLTGYYWPGNVRELQNLIEMLAVMNESEHITLQDLPGKIKQNTRRIDEFNIDIPNEGMSLSNTISRFEKKILCNALKKSGNVKSKAAKLLHLNRTTFVEKLKRYAIH
ncbi:MAG: sigma-54-dependent Fis family transcriptional regulator [Deltaproteobacteria bacterium]|nr:sigma-54-dependent Fis family transcriptional regulator [Deltaproteobacteria bacterium]